MCIHIYMYMYICMYIHIHIHMHTVPLRPYFSSMGLTGEPSRPWPNAFIRGKLCRPPTQKLHECPLYTISRTAVHAAEPTRIDTLSHQLGPYQDLRTDPKSRSILVFYHLHHRRRLGHHAKPFGRRGRRVQTGRLPQKLLLVDGNVLPCHLHTLP